MSPDNARSELPDSVRPYRRTSSFTETTVPAALRNMHATKDGVWARIVVERGRLLFERTDCSESQEIAEGGSVVVPPMLCHRVTPQGPVVFHVEFYR